MDEQKLVNLLSTKFDEGELKRLLDLELDIRLSEVAWQSSLRDTAYGIFSYCQRHGKLENLTKAVRKKRPASFENEKGSERRSTGWPSQLYPFWGRKDELRRMGDALKERSGWGVLIYGQGGVGKTSLAIESADRVENLFDQKLFLSAKKSELMSRKRKTRLSGSLISNFSQFLSRIGREIGEERIGELSLIERRERVLNGLVDRRMLMVIDNLETLSAHEQRTNDHEEEEILNFLEDLPEGNKAIVTSRTRLFVEPNVCQISLGKLEQENLFRIVRELAKNNKDLEKQIRVDSQVRKLIELTDGNPLLLTWVCGQVGHGACRDIETACAFLQEATFQQNNPLEYVFGHLVEEAFTHVEKRVLGTLSWIRESIDVELVMKVIRSREDWSEDEIKSALWRLMNQSIIMEVDNEENSKTECFLQMLPTKFFQRKLPDVVKSAGEHLLTQALEFIRASESHVQRFERDVLFERAWPCIEAALPLLIEGDNKQLQNICIRLDKFLEFSGRWDEWLQLNCRAEEKANEVGDWYNAGIRVCQAGWVHYLRGEAHNVLECTNRAKVHWRKINVGRHPLTLLCRLIGHGYVLQKQYGLAIDAYEDALHLWSDRREGGNDANVARILNDLGGAKLQDGRLDAAESDYQEALQTARNADYKEGVAYMTGNCAELALKREDWAKAEQFAQEALELSQYLNQREWIAEHRYWLATALSKQGRWEDALHHARDAKVIFAELRSPELPDVVKLLESIRMEYAYNE